MKKMKTRLPLLCHARFGQENRTSKMFERKTQYRHEAQFLVGWVISQVMARKVQPTYTPEEVKAAFKVFETPAVGMPPGHVKTSVLERALTTYGSEKLTLEEAQDLLSQVPPQICVCITFVCVRAR